MAGITAPTCGNDQTPLGLPEAQHLILDYSRKSTTALAEQALNVIRDDVECLASAVDKITIKGGHSGVLKADLTAVEQFIRRCPETLTDIYWEISRAIPPGIYNAIETSQPQSRLHYTDGFGSAKLEERRRIIGSKCLCSLKVDYVFALEYEKSLAFLQTLHDVITSCSGLRELDVSLRRPGGCVQPSETPKAFDFSQNKGSLPPLEFLRLNGYKLEANLAGKEQRPNVDVFKKFVPAPLSYLPESFLSSIYWGNQGVILGMLGMSETAYYAAAEVARDEEHSLELAQEPQNLNAWIDRMDFGNLKTLSIDKATPMMFHSLAPLLKSLQHLSVATGCSHAGAELPEFLRNVSQPLVSLDLGIFVKDYENLFAALNETSSGSLKSVHFRNYVDASALSRLAFGNPSIETMALPIKRSVLKSNVNDERLVALRATDNPQSAGRGSSNNTVRAELLLDLQLDYPAIYASAMARDLKDLKVSISSPDSTINSAIRKGRSVYYNLPKSLLTYDPDFNRTSIPKLFNEINLRRRGAGIPSLGKLTIIVGPADHGSDWGMGGPPALLIGKWICETKGEAQVCFGGNGKLTEFGWSQRGPIKDPFSTDWMAARPLYAGYEDSNFSSCLYDDEYDEDSGLVDNDDDLEERNKIF